MNRPTHYSIGYYYSRQSSDGISKSFRILCFRFDRYVDKTDTRGQFHRAQEDAAKKKGGGRKEGEIALSFGSGTLFLLLLLVIVPYLHNSVDSLETNY